MQLLALSLAEKPRFSTPYVLWSNGTVQSVLQEILRVMHVFNAEARISKAEWPRSVQAIHSIIINSPARRLGNRAFSTLHIGTKADNPLRLALSVVKIKNVNLVDHTRLLQKMKIDKVNKALESVHKEVNETLTTVHRQAIEHHNFKTHVVPYKPTL